MLPRSSSKVFLVIFPWLSCIPFSFLNDYACYTIFFIFHERNLYQAENKIVSWCSSNWLNYKNSSNLWHLTWWTSLMDHMFVQIKVKLGTPMCIYTQHSLTFVRKKVDCSKKSNIFIIDMYFHNETSIHKILLKMIGFSNYYGHN